MEKLKTVRSGFKADRLKNWIRLYWVFGAGIAVRLAFGLLIGNWFPSSEAYDDVLMLEYASLRHHFTEQNFLSLVKYMAYPLFLDAVRYSHLPYALWTGVLWSAAAVMTYRVFYEIRPHRGIAGFLFFYVLFLPVAFDNWGGTRIYRSGIQAPFTVFFFALLILLVLRLVRKEEKPRKIWLPALLLGLVFSFAYYVKEDGLWLLACLLFADAVLAAVSIARAVKEKKQPKPSEVRRLYASIGIPLLVFTAVTAGYLGINRHFFGVAELNTRTSGEVGSFVQKLYRIDSEDRTGVVWAPLDAVEQAFEASGTLKLYPKIRENLMKSPFAAGDYSENQIPGDLIGWALRLAVSESREVWNEAEVEALFATVNAEIDEAFRQGILQKDSRIQLLPSAGGKTFPEIVGLFTPIAKTYSAAVFLAGYQAGISEIPSENDGIMDVAVQYTNTPYLKDYSNGREVRTVAAKIAEALFWVYRIVNVLLILCMIASFVFWLLARKKGGSREVPGNRATIVFSVLTLIFFVLLSLAYAFAIGWFTSFIFADGITMYTLIFYTPAMPVLLAFAYGFGLILFREYLPVKGRKTEEAQVKDCPGNA